MLLSLFIETSTIEISTVELLSELIGDKTIFVDHLLRIVEAHLITIGYLSGTKAYI